MLMGGAISQQTWLGVLGFVVMLGSATLGLASWRGRHAPAAQPQRSGEDQLFDFDDHPHRFDVIEGGRTDRPRKLRRPGGAKPPRRPGPQGPQAGHLHAAHGAALGTPPPRGLLTPRSAQPGRQPRASAAGRAPATPATAGRASRAPVARCRPSPCATTRRSRTVRVRASGSTVAIRRRPARRAVAAPLDLRPADPPATRRRRPRAGTWSTTLRACSRGERCSGQSSPRSSAVARSSAQAPSARCTGSARREPAPTLDARARRRARAPSSSSTSNADDRPPRDRHEPVVVGLVSAAASSGLRRRLRRWRRRSGPSVGVGGRCCPAGCTPGSRPRAGRGRLEAHPADAGEVHLRPRVPVVAGVEDPAVGLRLCRPGSRRPPARGCPSDRPIAAIAAANCSQ